MNLTITNREWIERVASELGQEPEVILNAIVRQLRERTGERSGDLSDWLEAAGRSVLETSKEWEEWRNSRVVVEEAVRAARLYLEKVEQERAGHA